MILVKPTKDVVIPKQVANLSKVADPMPVSPKPEAMVTQKPKPAPAKRAKKAEPKKMPDRMMRTPQIPIKRTPNKSANVTSKIAVKPQIPEVILVKPTKDVVIPKQVANLSKVADPMPVSPKPEAMVTQKPKPAPKLRSKRTVSPSVRVSIAPEPKPRKDNYKDGHTWLPLASSYKITSDKEAMIVQPIVENIVTSAELLEDARLELGLSSLIVSPNELTELRTIGAEEAFVEEVKSSVEILEPAAIQTLYIVNEKVIELEPELHEDVAELFTKLHTVLQDIEATSIGQSLPEMTKIENLTEIIEELFTMLDVEYNHEQIAQIVAFMIEQHASLNEILQISVTQDRGTHEILDHMNGFFQAIKQMLEPLHTRVGRAALAASTA